MDTMLRLLKEEDGTTMFEYAMLSSLVAAAAIGAFVALGIKYMTLFAF